MSAKLISAVGSVDWNANIQTSIANVKAISDLHAACERIAVWATQFEELDRTNAAISFVRGMQVSAHHVVACVCLGLYGAAAASIRSVIESGLYYSYFRDHPKELETLVRVDSYYLSRSQIIEYHKLHTKDFPSNQNSFGLIGRLEQWYSRISAVVHGQIPGTWVSFKSLKEITPNSSTMDSVIAEFILGEKILHDFFLITVGLQNWDIFSSTAKRKLTSGLPSEIKTQLKLDRA